MHTKRKHPQEKFIVVDHAPNESDPRLWCEFCKKNFTNSRWLRTHMGKKHPQPNVKAIVSCVLPRNISEMKNDHQNSAQLISDTQLMVPISAGRKKKTSTPKINDNVHDVLTQQLTANDSSQYEASSCESADLMYFPIPELKRQKSRTYFFSSSDFLLKTTVNVVLPVFFNYLYYSIRIH